MKMLLCRYLFIFSIIFLFLFVSLILGAKLNVPRVLLPLFKQIQTNFTLEVIDTGCYRWSSSRTDIVQVIPLDMDENRGCCLKAMVTAVTKEPIRNTVIVLAEEVATGFVLRCDVIVDVIDSLNIVTTTRELFMEEAPEMFEVCAQDNQGNQFTTIEGIEFHWTIENIGQLTSSKEVLRFISFMNSPYETPPSVARFDSLGLQGHKVLVEGVKTGTAKVSVGLHQPEYSTLNKVEVMLTVLANLLLDPPDIHLLAGDTVTLRLLQMQNGRLEEVPLLGSEYSLDLKDKDVAVIDRSVVRGARLGQTKVILRDTHAEGTVKLPTANVVVTEPAYLRLSLLPHNNWAVLVDQPCTITVHLYDKNNHRIHIGDAVTIRVTVSEEYFQVYSMTRNGTVIDGVAKRVGTVPVNASLESVRAIGGKEVQIVPPISTQADMFIYPRLTATPAHVLVPWDPNLPKHEIQLTASGGDGNYFWRSQDLTVLSVTQTGMVRCNGLGNTSVIVSMTRNPAIKVSSLVEVRPPSHLEILRHSTEAPVREPIILHIILYADEEDEHGNLKRVHFTHCKHINFKVELSNEHFFQNPTASANPIDNACGTVSVIGKVLGTSVVKVSYKVNGITLEASTEVAAFNTLEVVQPERKVTVLAVGTSRHVVWKGGPQVWMARSAEHTRTVSSSSTAISVSEVPCSRSSEFYVYSVLCRELGEFKVELTVKIAAETESSKHSESRSSVRVICANPKTISFSVERPPNSSCPYSSDSSQIVALSYEPITVYVTVKDNIGRVFDNATSFYLDWILSKSELAYIQFDNSLVLEEKKENNYIIPKRHYQIIHPKNIIGTLIVDAIVVSYKLKQLGLMKIKPDYPAFGIENEQGEKVKPLIKSSLTIVLVQATTISPDRATIFNHPNNKVMLKVSEGSGFYKFYQSSSEIAEVKYKQATKTIEIHPKSDGHLQLTIIDLCLSYASPVVEIQVLKVGSLQVEMVERVQKGSSITATVWLYDSVENSLAVADSELLELRPHVDSNLVTVTRVKDASADGHVNFNISGVDLGNTFITFTSGFNDREIRSPRLPIEVFPPLRLEPQEVTLPVGAMFQLTVTGGPQQDFDKEYESSDGVIAKVNPSGLIEALKVGEITVKGSSVGKSKSTRTKVTYSKDQVNVRVIQLEGVKIQSPLTMIKVGCQMPVWATGIPEKLTPLVLGSIEPSLVFKWSTSTPDVVELRDTLHATGIQVPETDKLSMRVIGLKPGRVTIFLNITSKLGKCSEFFDQLQMEVFEELQVIKPKHIPTSSLLMAPFSYLRLRTNKDSVSQVTYNVVGSPDWSQSLQDRAIANEVPAVAVNRGGLLTSHGALGTAAVVVYSTEDLGLKQTIQVNVQVKPVHYIMLTVTTSLPVGSYVISAFPRGLALDMVVSYHDNTGEVFAATRTDIHTALNRADNVKVVRGEVNGTLVSQMSSYGVAVLKVWDDSISKKSQDYVKIKVDHLITPAGVEMTVGDVVCYSMPLAGGEWLSTAPMVLSVTPRTGLASALQPGQTTVLYTLASKGVSTSTTITVLPIHSMAFLPLDGRNLTDWGSFSVPLLLRSDKEGSGKVTNLLKGAGRCPSHNPNYPPPFFCEIRFNSPMAPVDIHQVFSVQPNFSINTGLYSCRFEAISTASVNTSVLSTNVTLRAISDNLVSEPLVVPFLPSVYLPAHELVLTNRQTSVSLTVIGSPIMLSHLQVILSETTFVAISAPTWPGVNRLEYKVSLKAVPPTTPLNLHLYVYSPLTGQNVTVLLRLNSSYDGLSAPCFAHPATQWYQPSADQVFTILLSIVVLVAVFLYSNWFSWIPAPYPPVFTATSTPITSQCYDSPFSPDSRRYIYRRPFSSAEPVYGDPNLSQSPGLTRRIHR